MEKVLRAKDLKAKVLAASLPRHSRGGSRKMRASNFRGYRVQDRTAESSRAISKARKAEQDCGHSPPPPRDRRKCLPACRTTKYARYSRKAVTNSCRTI